MIHKPFTQIFPVFLWFSCPIFIVSGLSKDRKVSKVEQSQDLLSGPCFYRCADFDTKPLKGWLEP